MEGCCVCLCEWRGTREGSNKGVELNTGPSVLLLHVCVSLVKFKCHFPRSALSV